MAKVVFADRDAQTSSGRVVPAQSYVDAIAQPPMVFA